MNGGSLARAAGRQGLPRSLTGWFRPVLVGSRNHQWQNRGSSAGRPPVEGEQHRFCISALALGFAPIAALAS